jgi:hypothetical protein
VKGTWLGEAAEHWRAFWRTHRPRLKVACPAVICPRCGVVNARERESCSRCSGSLAPPPTQDDNPLPPVLPVTRRAELKLGRASAPAPSNTDAVHRPPAAVQEIVQEIVPEPPVGDLYLLEADRSTGQPAPPASQSEPVRTDRPARVAVGLSRV